MSRRTITIAATLSVLALGSPLINARTNPLFIEYFNQGVERHEAGNYQGVIADCTKAIEVNPNYALAYSNRGNAKDDLKDYQGAIADYNKAIEINLKHAAA